MSVLWTGRTYRDQWLDSLRFQPQPDSWNYLEFHHYEEDSTFIREGVLKDFELSDWLNTRGPFELPLQNGVQISGAQRLLYTHRPQDRKASRRFENTIPCTKSMFVELTEFLKLPVGWCHDAGSKNPAVIKIPRTFWPDYMSFSFYRYTTKGDFALATSTDMKTGITTGIAYGSDTNYCDIPILQEMIALIKLQPLNHPLAFALPLLHRMTYQAECFLLDVRHILDTISAGLDSVDHEMTPQLIDEYREGKLDSRHTLDTIPVGSQFAAHEMTRQLKDKFREGNMVSQAAALSLMNRKIVSSTYYVTYNIFRHIELLIIILNELVSRLSSQQFQRQQTTASWIAAKDLFDMLQSSSAQANLDRENMNTRLQMLTTTLYNRIAQEDNNLSYLQAADMRRIAAAGRRDSSAMKTIAVLTSVFLPGTFVATMFGMNLFEYSPQEKRLVVSKSFWLYWAIAVPLTLLVMIIWLVWFHWSQKIESRRMDEEQALFSKEKML